MRKMESFSTSETITAKHKEFPLMNSKNKFKENSVLFDLMLKLFLIK